MMIILIIIPLKNMKLEAIPIIPIATENLSRPFQKPLETMDSGQSSAELTKTAIFGTIRLLRKILTYRFL
jgi:hypothetical protein